MPLTSCPSDHAVDAFLPRLLGSNYKPKWLSDNSRVVSSNETGPEMDNISCFRRMGMKAKVKMYRLARS